MCTIICRILFNWPFLGLVLQCLNFSFRFWWMGSSEFKVLQQFTCQVRSSSMFIIFGFDSTLLSAASSLHGHQNILIFASSSSYIHKLANFTTSYIKWDKIRVLLNTSYFNLTFHFQNWSFHFKVLRIWITFVTIYL